MLVRAAESLRKCCRKGLGVFSSPNADLTCSELGRLSQHREAVHHAKESCLMSLFHNLFQSLLPSSLSPETTIASVHQNSPATNPKQTHVLRTNPRRGSVPNSQPARKTSEASVTPKKKKNAAAVFIDRYDHMANDPIQVRISLANIVDPAMRVRAASD